MRGKYGLETNYIGNENLFFRCEDNAECRFYHWYPIDYSPAPLYCYIFR